MTTEQIKFKLAALCSKSEHCKQEMRTKMDRWEVAPQDQDAIINYLVEERYIDEERYARYFINDKMKYNQWGRRKIEQALYLKRIPREISDPIFDEIEDDSYEEILLPLLQNKLRSVKGNSAYEIRGKLTRFAMQRGFSYDQISHCLDEIIDSTFASF